MAIAVLKVLTDSAWYLAFMMPIIASLSGLIGKILLMVPLLWALYLAVFWKKRDFISDTQDMVLFEVKILLVIGGFELLIVGPVRWQALCGRPVLLFLIFGVFLLRAGRIADAPGEKRGFWGVSGISVLTVFLAAVVLTSETVLNSVWYFLRTIYNCLVIPVLEMLIWAVAGILSAFVPLFSMIFPESALAESQEVLQMNLDNPLELDAVSTVQMPLFVKIAGYLLLVLAAAAILFFLYRKIAGNAFGWDRKAAGSVTRSRDDKSGGKASRRVFSGRERNVRYYYRKLLMLCVEKGLDTKRPVTSSDVHRLAALYWNAEESGEFRELYRLVRYGGGQEDESRKKRARELYQSFRASLSCIGR